MHPHMAEAARDGVARAEPGALLDPVEERTREPGRESEGGADEGVAESSEGDAVRVLLEEGVDAGLRRKRKSER